MAPVGYMPDIARKIVAVSSWHFSLNWIESECLNMKPYHP
jgi:hypothetical protein